MAFTRTGHVLRDLNFSGERLSCHPDILSLTDIHSGGVLQEFNVQGRLDQYLACKSSRQLWHCATPDIKRRPVCDQPWV